jgi:hypothetical protein
MKQRDLLFAGLLLFAAPAFAQPGVTEPVFDADKDAKLIFSQDFEADFATWSKIRVDSITQMEYYDHEGNSNGTSFKPWDEPDKWQKGIFRDTTMILYNGVVVYDNMQEKWTETVEQNVQIVQDAGQEKSDRQAAMAAFGEADNGGNYYFQFTSDSAPILPQGNNSYSSGLAARYRRNLFVRGLDIQDNTSYRLTFYAKAKTRNAGSSIVPTLYTDIMRGYFHAEKPFTMGYKNDANNLEYNNKFEFTKSDFLGDEWEKCTYMTYYLTDSIANYYVFVDGYWWASGDWTWQSSDSAGSTNPKKYDLNYTVQPDKFFVRLGFASDSSVFAIDNMSLTRSTIGGVEYYQDKLRVNFGYETDLKKLAKAAEKETKIAAVELPGDYFEVWGKYSDGTWEPTDIASAEYQGDGYMYLFADFYDDPVTGEKKRYTFDQYDTVLVSFINPTEPELELHYTGTMFPQATNKEWIRAGKRVLNFTNEVAALNPYVFANVYSMYDRAPVMQGAEIEESSFGLDGTIRTFKFKFSREMEIDNPANKETRQKCIVYAGTEIWDREWNEADSTLIVTRPQEYTTPLSGDVVIEIKSIYVPNTTNKGENVAAHYNFGAINRDLSTISFGSPVWESKLYDNTLNDPAKTVTPEGIAMYYKDGNNMLFRVGDGTASYTTNAARLYVYSATGLTYPKGLMISGRNSSSVPAEMYLGYGDKLAINLTPGNYVLNYKAQPINMITGLKVYVFPWDKTPQNLTADDKVLVAEHNNDAFSRQFPEDLCKNASNNIDTLLITSFSDGFNIEKEGRYIIEISMNPARNSGNYTSMLFSNIELYASPIAYSPIKAVNDAVEATQARMANATASKYAGAALTLATSLVNTYKADAAQPYASTSPSEWYATAKTINEANDALKLRMDTVDLVFAKQAEADTKLANVAADSTAWASLASYTTLKATKESVESYPFSEKTNAELTAFIKKMDDEIKALDARVANNKELVNQLKRSNDLLTAAKHTEYAEFDALQDAYDEYVVVNAVTASDDEIQAAVDGITAAANAYDFRVIGFEVSSVRIVALQALATKLGSTIADSADVKAALENLEGDADLVADVFKAAIKLAIYEKAAANVDDKLIDSLDVTPFIKNYTLYTTARLGAKNSKETVDKTKEANVYSVQTGWYPNEAWTDYAIATRGEEFTTTFPGWKFKSFGGQNYIGQEKADWTAADHKPIFDAFLASDWSSQAYISQELVDLPVGQYTLGAGLTMDQDAGADATLSAITPDSTYVANVSVKSNNVAAANTFIDSIKVNADTITIKVNIPSHNSWIKVDNFVLAFRPDKTFGYAAAAAAEQAKMTELLTIVSPAKAIAANVEYYTLGGVQVAAPKAGQILIRKTNVNGKVVVDKVLLK